MDTVGVCGQFVVDRFDGVIAGSASDSGECGIGHSINKFVNGCCHFILDRDEAVCVGIKPRGWVGFFLMNLCNTDNST